MRARAWRRRTPFRKFPASSCKDPRGWGEPPRAARTLSWSRGAEGTSSSLLSSRPESRERPLPSSSAPRERWKGHGLDSPEDLKNRERRVPCSPGNEKRREDSVPCSSDHVPCSSDDQNWREGRVPCSSDGEKRREDRLPSSSRDREKWEDSLPSSSDDQERRERHVPSSSRYRETREGPVPSFPSLQNSLKNFLRTFADRDERRERRVPSSPVAGRVGKMAFPGLPEGGEAGYGGVEASGRRGRFGGGAGGQAGGVRSFSLPAKKTLPGLRMSRSATGGLPRGRGGLVVGGETVWRDRTRLASKWKTKTLASTRPRAVMDFFAGGKRSTAGSEGLWRDGKELPPSFFVGGSSVHVFPLDLAGFRRVLLSGDCRLEFLGDDPCHEVAQWASLRSESLAFLTNTSGKSKVVFIPAVYDCAAIDTPRFGQRLAEPTR